MYESRGMGHDRSYRFDGIRNSAVAVFIQCPEKRERGQARYRVNVFVSKAAPVETRVILCDPTLSSRTYFASFSRATPAAAVISYAIFCLSLGIFHREIFAPSRIKCEPHYRTYVSEADGSLAPDREMRVNEIRVAFTNFKFRKKRKLYDSSE